MKARLIAAAVLIPVLLLVVLAAPKWLAAIVIGLLLALAAYEMLYRTHLVRHPRLVIWSAIMAFAVSIWSYFGADHGIGVAGALVFSIVLFSEMMHDHIKVRFSMIALCFVAGLVMPFLLSAMVRILIMKIGKYVVLVPFTVAFINDAGAYFAGLYFGKHKLAPVVSPNKTIEGVIGGLIASVFSMVIYALILQIADFRVSYGLAILYGLLGSVIGVFGDLCLSVIKRQSGIKDYGNLIPGHGGILDRFDSMMTVAPLMEILLLWIPFAEG